MTAYIGYDAIGADPARQTNITASSAFLYPDNPIENLLDYSTYTIAKFGSIDSAAEADIGVDFNGQQTVQYIGIMQHNLPVGSTVEVKRSSLEPAIASFPVTHTGPLLFILSEAYRDTFMLLRFLAPGGANPGTVSIGVLMYGELLPLPEGLPAPYTPPPLERDTDTYSSISGTGNFLQSHVQRTGWQFSIIQQNVDPDWVRANWPALVFHAERYPFFYSWDQESYPEDCMYGWVSRKVKPPVYQNPLYMSWSMSCRGLHA